MTYTWKCIIKMRSTTEAPADAAQKQNEGEPPLVAEAEKNIVPKGKYTLVGFDLDAAGRRLSDEIIHIAAYSGQGNAFQQYIMPYMNINPSTRERHMLRVICIGYYRTLRSDRTCKIIRGKAEVLVLTAFLEWLERLLANDVDSNGIILAYNEACYYMAFMLIEAMKRYNLQDRFFKSVIIFLDLRQIIKADADEARQQLTLSQFYKCLIEENALQPFGDEQEFAVASADARARLAFKVAAILFKSSINPEFENTAEAAVASLDNAKVQGTVEEIQPYCQTPKTIADKMESHVAMVNRQGTYRKVFKHYLSSTTAYRNRAIKYRFILCQNGYTLSDIKEAWKDKKKEGLMALFELIGFEHAEKVELTDLFERHFNPHKFPIKPYKQIPTYRRRSRGNMRYDNAQRRDNKEDQPKARDQRSNYEQSADADKLVAATVAHAVAEKTSHEAREEAEANKGDSRGQRSRINNVRGGRGRDTDSRRTVQYDNRRHAGGTKNERHRSPSLDDNEDRRSPSLDDNDRGNKHQNGERRYKERDSHRRRTGGTRNERHRSPSLDENHGRLKEQVSDRRRGGGTKNQRRRSPSLDDNDRLQKEQGSDPRRKYQYSNRRRTEQNIDRRQSDKENRKAIRDDNAAKHKYDSRRRRIERDSDSLSYSSRTDDDGSRSPDRREKKERSQKYMPDTYKRNQRKNHRNDLPRTNSASQTSPKLAKECPLHKSEKRGREEQCVGKATSAELEQHSADELSDSGGKYSQEQIRPQKHSDSGGRTRMSQPLYERERNQHIDSKSRNNNGPPRYLRNRSFTQSGRNNGPSQMTTQQPLVQRN